MATYSSILTAFQTTYPDCPDATAVQLLNDIDEEILSVIPYRKSTLYVPFVNGQAKYDADETVIKIHDGALLNTDLTRQTLEQVGESQMDYKWPGWRGSSPATPRAFGTTSSLTSGQYFVWPAPNWSSLIISGVTNASPPVVTTTLAHGISSGTRVSVENTGVVSLSGSFYFKSLSTFTGSLYTDSALTVPVGAPGSTPSTGNIGTATNQLLVLDVTQRVALTSASAQPLGPQLRRLYADGMRWLWSLQKHWNDAPQIEQQFRKDLAEAQQVWEGRTEDVLPEIKTFRQDMRCLGGRRGNNGSGWTRIGDNNWV